MTLRVSSTLLTVDWRAEIIELHAVFDAWFRDASVSLDRFEDTMDQAFTIISPSGVVASAAEVVEVVRSGGGRAPEQSILTSDHELLADSGDLVVARYVEHHRTPHVSSQRRSTVVFRRHASAPNGLRWLTVQETWTVPPAVPRR